MEKQSIGRYILLGFSFVIVFVVVAYLAYRFSNRTPESSRTTNQVSTSPTPAAQLPSSLSSQPAPAPLYQPVNPRPLFSVIRPQPIMTQVPKLPTGASPEVAYNGDGKILLARALLTHEEHFQLERARIQAGQAIKLQELDGLTKRELAKLEIEQQKLAGEIRAKEQEVRLEETRLAVNQRSYDSELKLKTIQTQSLVQLASQIEQLKLEFAKLELERSVSNSQNTLY